MAEWLGRGLQNLLRRFESACRLLNAVSDKYVPNGGEAQIVPPRSSRGLGRRPFTAVTRVQIPYAVPTRSFF